MLTGAEIRAAGLIVGGDDRGYRSCSYDVAIDRVILAGGSVTDTHVLVEQGIVQVFSRERLQLPPDVAGMAMVKTSLCNEGVLALSSGVLDPGYDGLISTFLVNFGNSPRLLTSGETFLRLQFFRMSAGTGQPWHTDTEAYIAARRRQATRIGDTFLNLGTVVEAATNRTFEGWRNRILAYAGASALFLGVLTFLLNYGSLAVVKGWLQPGDTVRADLYRNAYTDQSAALVRANTDLAARVSALEAELRATRPAPARP